jgi:hypothetical protein
MRIHGQLASDRPDTKSLAGIQTEAAQAHLALGGVVAKDAVRSCLTTARNGRRYEGGDISTLYRVCMN